MKRRWWILLWAGLSACESAPPRELVVRAGRLIDGTGAPPRVDVRLRIRDGMIVAIEPDTAPVKPGEGMAVIDARGLTVLPGLVNSHAHLFSAGACHAHVGAGPIQAVRNLHALLEGGVTTVADLGAPVGFAVALRRHVGTGRHRGPRVLVAGPILTVAGGYPIDMLGPTAVEQGMVRVIHSKVGARAAVRRLAVEGVDLVKVALQEESHNGRSIPMLEGELLCAVVEEAHEQELRVVAHATTYRSWTAAIECGVDAIMHGCLDPLDEELVARVKRAGIPVAPTHFVFEAPLWGPTHLEMLDRPEVMALLPAETIEDLREYAEQDRMSGEMLPPFLMSGISRAGAHDAVANNLTNTGRLHAAAVPLGLGTDAAICFALHGSPFEELKRLESAGLTPLEVLSVATHGGARILNLHDALGKLHPGFRADIIAVEGQPDVSLTDIANVRLVIIDGVVQKLEGPSLGEQASAVSRMAWTWLWD